MQVDNLPGSLGPAQDHGLALREIHRLATNDALDTRLGQDRHGIATADDAATHGPIFGCTGKCGVVVQVAFHVIVAGCFEIAGLEYHQVGRQHGQYFRSVTRMHRFVERICEISRRLHWRDDWRRFLCNLRVMLFFLCGVRLQWQQRRRKQQRQAE